MFTRVLAGPLLACSVAWPAVAETFTVYSCSYRLTGGGDDRMDLLFASDNAGETFLFDTPPGSQTPERIPVTIRPAGPGASIFMFAISVPNPETGRVYVTFQARVPKADGPSRLKLDARGFRGESSGTGTCKVETNVRQRF